MSAKYTFVANPGSLEVTTTYTFDMPQDRVFAGFTDPNLIPKWWLEDEEITVDRMEVKEGGTWRFVEKTNEGTFVFRGVYHRVDAPKQIVTTWAFEAMSGVFLETVTFEVAGGRKTKVTDQFVFQTLEDRNMMLETGMNNGSVDMMQRLEKLL